MTCDFSKNPAMNGALGLFVFRVLDLSSKDNRIHYAILSDAQNEQVKENYDSSDISKHLT